MGGGVAGGSDTVAHGSSLLTPGPRPSASLSASAWAVTHRLSQAQKLAEVQAPRSPAVHTPSRREASTLERRVCKGTGLKYSILF